VTNGIGTLTFGPLVGIRSRLTAPPTASALSFIPIIPNDLGFFIFSELIPVPLSLTSKINLG
jgi:hypothetical protein